MNMVALIPAFNPDDTLLGVVAGLLDWGFQAVVVVDDGSDEIHAAIFAGMDTDPRIHLLRHAVNLGKGAALKTGLNHAYCRFSDSVGVVTLDADGQHLPEDAFRVAQRFLENPDSLVLGVRSFTGDVPLRSRFGNGLTRVLFRALVGQGLTDTQTGLRGIPREFITTLLRLDSSGYEFELDMLLACKHAKRQILETPIRTVYSEGNRSSHFNPLLDSMRIYFVLFRFLFASLITAAIDYTVFFAVYRAGFPLVASQAAARLVAMLFNYGAVKKMVFLSQRKHAEAFPRYALLVILSGTASYFLITVLTYLFDLPVIVAKATAEGLIFLANFAIQRDFIFTKKNKEDAATDWDRYYKQPFKAARLSRSVTEQLLIRLIDRYGASGKGELRIAELGGGNSCFYNGIVRAFEPCEYHVVDNNAIGLKKLKEREGGDGRLILHSQDVLNLNVSLQCDLVFSVGLIEHFSPDDTRKAIEAHFALLRPGGVAIISFPTPTFLYRGARWVAEFTRSWIFHDERPLCREEVAASLAGCGEVMFEKLNWPILLTQRVMVVRKRG